VIAIRHAVAADAQKIGAVFNSAVSKGWQYLGELAREPMFPPEEWDKVVTEHAPPNALLVAVKESDEIVGFTGFIRKRVKCTCCSFSPTTPAKA
jgi:hypothetical protein